MKTKWYFNFKNHLFALATLFIIFNTMIMNKAIATNYYVSATGSDADNGLSPLTPWQTITKVNAYFSSFSAGDAVLFKRGDAFYGAIVITKSGTVGNPIVIGAYGTGAKPLITGFTDATNWTSVGTNLWECSAISGANAPNMVTINAKPIGMGRYPNSGYLKFESSVLNSSITDNELTGTPNWTGGEVVIRKVHWILSRDVITNHTGSTINYTGTSGYNSTNGYGYFIQNHLSTLDAQNEWFFNNTTKKLTVYSTTTPSGVKVSSKDILINIDLYDYIHVDNISFIGANVAAVNGGSSGGNQGIGIIVKNCDINYSGKEALYFTNSINCIVENNTINNSFNNAILFRNLGGFSNDNIIRYNKIKNTGVIPGMNYSVYSNQGITVYGNNALIEYNTVDSTGYLGIAYYYNDSKVKHNTVSNFCFVKDDGAGIYSWSGYDNSYFYTGREVIANVVTGGIGAGAGTLDNANLVHGIYIDDGSRGVVCDSNTVYNTNNGGLYLHNCQNITVRHNTVYNASATQLLIVHDENSPNTPVRNLVMEDNIFVAKLTGADVVTIRTSLNDVANFGTIDKNYYYKPIDDNIEKFKVQTKVGTSWVNSSYTLGGWKAAYPVYDVNSLVVPINIAKYKIDRLNTSNLFSNGQFETNIAEVGSFPASSSWDNTSKIAGLGSLKITPSAPSASYIMIYGNIGPVISTKKYILRFTTLGSAANGALRVAIRKTNSDWSNLIARQGGSFGLFKKTHEFLFTGVTDNTAAAFLIEIQMSSGVTYIDGIEFYEADATVLTLDDQLRFEVTTNVAKTVTLAETSISVDSKIYTGPISLKPYSSILLFNKILSTPTGLIKETLNAKLTAYAYRNIEIRVTGQVSKNAVATLYDVHGRVVLIKNMEYGKMNIVPTPNLKTGIYMLSVTDNGKLTGFKILVRE